MFKSRSVTIDNKTIMLRQSSKKAYEPPPKRVRRMTPEQKHRLSMPLPKPGTMEKAFLRFKPKPQ